MKMETLFAIGIYKLGREYIVIYIIIESELYKHTQKWGKLQKEIANLSETSQSSRDETLVYNNPGRGGYDHVCLPRQLCVCVHMCTWLDLQS